MDTSVERYSRRGPGASIQLTVDTSGRNESLETFPPVTHLAPICYMNISEEVLECGSPNSERKTDFICLTTRSQNRTPRLEPNRNIGSPDS